MWRCGHRLYFRSSRFLALVCSLPNVTPSVFVSFVVVVSVDVLPVEFDST